MRLFYSDIRGNLVRLVILTMLPVLALVTLLAAGLIHAKAMVAQHVVTEGGVRTVLSRAETLWQEGRVDVLFVAQLSGTREALAAGGRLDFEDGRAPEGTGLIDLKSVLSGLLSTRRFFSQFRIINCSGEEILRLVMRDGHVQAIPSDGLQNKSDRYYFQETMKCAPGDCYVSRIDLNQEYGKIERPLTPTVRVGAPVLDDNGRALGIVVANLLINDVLRVPAATSEPAQEAGHWFTVDAKGYYLYNPRHPEREWGGPEDLDTGYNLHTDFPREADRIIAGGVTRVDDEDGSKTIFSSAFHPLKGSAQELVLCHVVPTSVVLQQERRGLAMLVLASLLALSLATVLAVAYGRRIVRPLVRLSEDMEAFQRDGQRRHTAYEGTDEIRTLYDRFNAMADELAQRQEDLEARVAERTQELNESRQAALSLMQDANAQSDKLAEALRKLEASETALRHRIDWAIGIQRADEELTACATIEQVAEVAVRSLVAHLKLHSAWIGTFEDDGSVTPRKSAGADLTTAGAGDCARLVRLTGKAVIVEDVNVGRDAHCSEGGRRFGFRSCGTYPIVVRNAVIGTLTVRSEDSGPAGVVAESAMLVEVFTRKVGLVWQRCLAEAEVRKLSLAVEQSPASIVITDLKGNIEYVNPKFTEVSGYTAEEVVGSNPSILKTDHTTRDEYDRLWETIMGGNVWEGEFLNRRKGGDLYWESASIAPIRDERGVTTGFLAVKADITALKRATTQLEEARNAADRANRAKSDFLANMSHELRTPLNAIIGFSEVLRDETFGEVNAKQRRYLDHILNGGKHLLDLINDILDLSKIEAGKMDLQTEPLYVSEMLANSLVLIREKATRHGIRLETDIADDVQTLEVEGDRRKLKQVIYNLLSNAAKFTPEGGQITLSALREGDRLVVSVADTGIGIAPEDQDRVFQEFEQVDSSYGKTQQGTGLGLALVRRLVELHGGRVWVESHGVGHGSKFTFVIPVLQSVRTSREDTHA